MVFDYFCFQKIKDCKIGFFFHPNHQLYVYRNKYYFKNRLAYLKWEEKQNALKADEEEQRRIICKFFVFKQSLF
jgi:hypothetical protein